jgi:nicotinamidase-related amidase
MNRILNRQSNNKGIEIKMKSIPPTWFGCTGRSLILLATFAAAALAAPAAEINIHLQTREASITQKTETWNPAETAIIICVMWDKHWCEHATARVVELAPALDKVLAAARAKGVKIIHAPSDTMAFYKNHPGRKEAQKYNTGKTPWLNTSPGEKGAKWPVEAAKGGCAACPQNKPRPWIRQIDTLTVKPGDIVSENGTEITGWLKANNIKNVILTGVATNMCVVGRPFGLRAMKQAGFNTALMRDMTDLMYNNEKNSTLGAPHVGHYAGLALMVAYIERYIAPTLLSTDITGAPPFHFQDDPSPHSPPSPSFPLPSPSPFLIHSHIHRITVFLRKRPHLL